MMLPEASSQPILALVSHGLRARLEGNNRRLERYRTQLLSNGIVIRFSLVDAVPFIESGTIVSSPSASTNLI